MILILYRQLFTVKETAENAVKVSQIIRAAKVAETPGAAQVANEADENKIEASQIVGEAKVAIFRSS